MDAYSEKKKARERVSLRKVTQDYWRHDESGEAPLVGNGVSTNGMVDRFPTYDTKILAVVNNKGGVGKTTTVVNMAAALSIKAPVLLVDLDSQGSATLSLGHFLNGAKSIHDVLYGGLPIKNVIQPSTIEGLDLIAGGIGLLETQHRLAQDASQIGRLAETFRPLRGQYAYIIMDCTPTFTNLSCGALASADGCIVPVMPHFLALEGLNNLVQTMDYYDRRAVPLAPIWGIVLTMVDYRHRSTRKNVHDIRAFYGNKVFQTEILFNIELAEAPATGKSVFEYALKSNGSRSYWNLSKEISRRSETPRPQGGASSLLPSDLREHRIRSDLWHSSPSTGRGILLITRKQEPGKERYASADHFPHRA